MIENVWAENFRAKDMKYEVAILTMDYTADPNHAAQGKPPLFRNIHIRGVVGLGAPVAIRIQGLEDSLIQDITFENITVAATQGVVANNVKNLFFQNVDITPEKGPVFALKNASNILISGTKAPAGTEVFLALEGEGSHDVRIEDSDLSAAKVAYVIGAGVDAGAVHVK